MKKNFTLKSLLMAAALLAGTGSMWAQDVVVTNTSIGFGGELTAKSNKWSYTLAEGETGIVSGEYWSTSNADGKKQGVIINADQRLFLSNGNISFDIPEAGAKDAVTVQFTAALGGQWNASGTKNTTITFTVGDNEVIKEQYNANNNTITASTMGITTDNITIGTGAPDWSKAITFTFMLDYLTKKITLATTCANKTDFSGNIDMPDDMAKGGTFKITAPNVGYQERGVLLDDLQIQTTERPADSHSYTINAMCEGMVLQELATGTVAEEATFSIEGLPKVIEKEGQFYVLNSESFTQEFVMGTADVVEEIEYTEDDKIVFFAEVENLSNATGITERTTTSGGKFAAINAGRGGSLGTIAAGKYTVTANFIANGKRGCYLRTSTSNTAENVVINMGADGWTGEHTSAEFTLESATALYLTGYTSTTNQVNRSADMDYIIIREVKGTTGIQNTKTAAANDEVFNLAGQRVAQPTKGLYITNGKKIVIR